MAIRTIQLDKIVDYMNSNVNISAVVPGGIWFGQKARDDNQDATVFDTYINTRIVSDVNSNTLVDKTARIEFYIVAHRNAIPAELVDIIEVITNELIADGCPTLRYAGDFHIAGIEEGNMFGPEYDPHNRVLLSKDYLFHYWYSDG